MSEQPPTSLDPVAGLLGDLETIAGIAQAGIRAPDTALEPGETRPCAVLYLDVVGFTELARQLPPDDLARLIDRTFRIFEVTVRGSGGYCDKVIGDAALFVFPGHPHHAPACQAALHSALGLRRRLAQINQSLGGVGIRLAIRAGITFGTVSRQRVGGGQQQLTVMGEVINLAQRLEATATADTICTVAEVVSETELLFDFAAAGTRELKGFGPTAVF
jgi:adenylate cyclase